MCEELPTPVLDAYFVQQCRVREAEEAQQEIPEPELESIHTITPSKPASASRCSASNTHS